MNRNKTNKKNDIEHLSCVINNLKKDNDVYKFLTELLTEAELDTLSKRWRILNMLNEGCTQREIAKELNVSLCKVTRGAKIIKNSNSLITQYLKKEFSYE